MYFHGQIIMAGADVYMNRMLKMIPTLGIIWDLGERKLGTKRRQPRTEVASLWNKVICWH